LAAVGLLGWHRTRDLRDGRLPGHALRGDPRASARSSWTTWLAAGVALAAGGATAANLAGGRPLSRLLAALILAWASVALVSGIRARVTGVSATASCVRIRYARRHPFIAAWPDLAAIVPPRWPMGCWRIRTMTEGSRTLMPSDLLGAEDVLREAVARAGLRFDGRAWTNGP
jgi:hypothetical protein